jgi:hypothetical protein
MKNEIKNNHSESITLFVKKGGVEQQVYIPAGHSIVVDAYETKTMRVFAKRGFISIIPAQLFTSDSFALLNDEPANEISVSKTIDETISSNNDETMDQFHTTEDNEAILLDEDMKYFQKNLMAALTLEENPNRLEVKSNDSDPTILEIIEGEVEQYVEGGFIKGEWTEEDLAFLKKNYPVKGRKYCSTHLNRNESSVQKKINALGLKKKKKKK